MSPAFPSGHEEGVSVPLKSKPTLGISNHDVKHNVSLFHKPEEVQSYTKMQESNDPVLLHFEQSLQQLLPFNLVYVDRLENNAK